MSGPTQNFHYVYILSSLSAPDQKYIGQTRNLKKRLYAHNAGQSPHTSKYRPWQMESAFAFRTELKALAFEKYLKTGSGRAFAKKHF